MKKYLGLLVLAAVTPADAAQIVNVDYIVKYVKQKHGIDVPHNAEQIRWAANMEYLLGVVDWVNKQNGFDTSYGTGPYATRIAVDTIAANKAIEELIKPANTVPGCDSGATFCFHPRSGTSFKFTISAKGTFTIDWGDGTVETIKRTNTTATEYSHDYAQSADNYWIGLSGTATGYSTAANYTTAAIRFEEIYGSDPENAISEIRGCLSCVFPYISSASGQYPTFYYTFSRQAYITEIPETLFENITIGAPYMFKSTFEGLYYLESVPAKLFSRITTGATYLFGNTFGDCQKLTKVPEDLFAGITEGADYMFESTFIAAGIKTVPAKLFSRITSGGKYMFDNTFMRSDISTVPEDLFAGITEGAESMFRNTFYNCIFLTTIPTKLFSRITTGGKSMFSSTFEDSAIESIPENAFAGLTTGTDSMFIKTFAGCTNLKSLPDNLFPNLTTGATNMFKSTFEDSDLRTVGNILPKLTAGKSYPTEMFRYTFSGNKYLTNTLKVGESELELWEMWPNVTAYQYTYSGATRIPDESIPTVWR